MKIDGYAYADNGEMDEIKELVDEDIDTSKEESSIHKSSKSQHRDSKINKSKEEFSQELNISENKSENYEKEINDLESTLEKLKEENELVQRKINIIYEFRKKEGREEKNFYKESNINESTYADSLTSTAGLYNDLSNHKMKLDQDLRRYQQSIEEQEKRKQDVYDILMKYKESYWITQKQEKARKFQELKLKIGSEEKNF